MCLEGAPVPGTLKALGYASNPSVLWSLRSHRGLDGLCCSWSATVGALAVGAAGTEMLPLAEVAVATIASAMPLAFWVEAGKFIEAYLVA